MSSRVWPEQMTRIQKVVELNREASGRASGCCRQAEGWAEYIVTLMRLSDSSWWSGCVCVPARLTPLNAHAVNPCWTLASRTKPRGRLHMARLSVQPSSRSAKMYTTNLDSSFFRLSGSTYYDILTMHCEKLSSPSSMSTLPWDLVVCGQLVTEVPPSPTQP